MKILTFSVRVRLALVAVLLVGGSATSPHRPATTIIDGVVGLDRALAAGWQQVLAVGSAVERD